MRMNAPAAITLFTLAALFACGSDGSTVSGAADDGGGEASLDPAHPGVGGLVDGGLGGDAGEVKDAASPDAGPSKAPYGLDKRPSNTTCIARKRPVVDTGVTLQRMWPGIEFPYPVGLQQAPGDNDRWYETDFTGHVYTLTTNATTQTDLNSFADVPNILFGGEAGFLGFAFSPNWQTSHVAYLSYTRLPVAGDPGVNAACGVAAPNHTEVLARYKSTDGGKTLAPIPDELLKVGHPYNNHNGGDLHFSPIDGMLYFSLGDGGSGGDPCGSGQDRKSFLGKMIRIDPSGLVPGSYAIPKDNPFVGSATTLNEIYALGLRNPWRWSFDKGTGDVWVGDVGQSAFEEIDRIVPGGDYGWNVCEGFEHYGITGAPCATPGMVDPVVAHGRNDAQAIIGGYVYRGTALPSLVGTYIYGDFELGTIWALTYDTDGTPVPKVIASLQPGTLLAFGQGNDGEVYTLDYLGAARKLVPSAPPQADTFPQLLSQTGCVDPNDATKPSATTIPYDVNSPLWSDGAQKDRFFAVPDGAAIGVGADGDWDLPIGSVAMKTFVAAGKRVETRLFMRHDDGGWAGYTYEWNDQGTDATLLPAGKVKTLANGQRWTFPSRQQCLQCHSPATGGTIGLETAQLNRDFVYDATNRISNELATLDHIGLFTSKLSAAPASLPKLPVPAGTDPLESRSRSYLHANCAFCHRPGGGGRGTMDLRYAGTFADTQTCNAPTTQGSIGGSSVILSPGAPSQSVLSLRVHAVDGTRMPPVAVSQPDPLGTALLDEWISGVATCP
jgi:uncharacterized repeat protein (TIGR03806 family)